MKVYLLIFSLILTSASWANEVIRVVASEGLPPLMWSDNGIPRGMAVELGKAIFKKAGFRMKVETCPWVRCQLIAEYEGAFIVGFSKNEERLKKFFYSDVYMYDNVVIAVKKGREFPFRKEQDLKGKKIGHQMGSSYGERFERLKKIFNPQGDSGDVLRIKKIVAQRIDGGVFSLGSAGVNYALKLSGLSSNELTVLPEAISKDPNFIGTGMKTPGAKEKLEKINKAIKELKEDGTIDRIMKQKF